MERANSYQSEDFIGCDVSGTELGLLSIRSCGGCGGWGCLREKRKESFFSSGTRSASSRFFGST